MVGVLKKENSVLLDYQMLEEADALHLLEDPEDPEAQEAQEDPEDPEDPEAREDLEDPEDNILNY